MTSKRQHGLDTWTALAAPHLLCFRLVTASGRKAGRRNMAAVGSITGSGLFEFMYIFSVIDDSRLAGMCAQRVQQRQHDVRHAPLGAHPPCRIADEIACTKLPGVEVRGHKKGVRAGPALHAARFPLRSPTLHRSRCNCIAQRRRQKRSQRDRQEEPSNLHCRMRSPTLAMCCTPR